MIATTLTASQTNLVEFDRESSDANDWRRLAADVITDPAELLDILGLDRVLLPNDRRWEENAMGLCGEK